MVLVHIFIFIKGKCGLTEVVGKKSPQEKHQGNNGKHYLVEVAKNTSLTDDKHRNNGKHYLVGVAMNTSLEDGSKRKLGRGDKARDYQAEAEAEDGEAFDFKGVEEEEGDAIKFLFSKKFLFD